MRSRVLVDVSMLAHQALPTDESWWMDRANSSFELVFPQTLAAFLRGETDQAANLLGELIVAYKGKKPAGDSGQAATEADAEEGELRTTMLHIADQYGRAFQRLEGKGLIEEYAVADNSEQAAWLQRLIQDEDLRDYIRNAYATRLGLPRDAQLDQYFFDVLAGMTVAGSAAAPDPHLLVSSGSETLHVLSDAVGPPVVSVNALLPGARDKQLQNLQHFEQTRGQLAAELASQPPALVSRSQAGNLLLSTFVGRSPADLIAEAPVARSVFLAADEAKLNGKEEVAPSAPSFEWRTVLLALLALLLVTIGPLLLRYSGSIVDMFTATSTPASTAKATPRPEATATMTPTSERDKPDSEPDETPTLAWTPTSGLPGSVAPVVIYVNVVDTSSQVVTEVVDRRNPFDSFDQVHPAHFQSDYPRPYPDFVPNPRTYIVRPGDTVYGLARRFGVPPEAIVQANQLANPNYIRVGEVLVVP